MTKVIALSFGILLVLILVSFAIFRKKTEADPRPQDSELSLSEKRTSPDLNEQKSSKKTDLSERIMARRAETDNKSKDEKTEDVLPTGSSEPDQSDAKSTADEDLGIQDGSETNIKPETLPPAFDIKTFAVDEVLALPISDKQKFLERNKLAEPEKFKRFRYLTDVGVIDRLLKGRYKGTIEGKGWIVALDITGQVEGEHFSGDLAVNLFSANEEPISRSSTSGPLDSHVRVVEEGDKNSLLILPSSEGESSMFQIFIGEQNRSVLAGNYYEKGEDGTFERIGPFVLKRI